MRSASAKGLLPALPLGAVGFMAELGALRGVDAVQANELAVDLQRIAVDHGGDADQDFGKDQAWQQGEECWDELHAGRLP